MNKTLKQMRSELSKTDYSVHRQGGEWILSIWNPKTSCHHESPMSPHITTERAAVEEALERAEMSEA